MQIESIQTRIEQRLSTSEPDVEVLACEPAGRDGAALGCAIGRTVERDGSGERNARSDAGSEEHRDADRPPSPKHGAW